MKLPQGYDERPWDYKGQLYTEGQMHAAIAAMQAKQERTEQLLEENAHVLKQIHDEDTLTIEELRVKLEQAEKDAARYRAWSRIILNNDVPSWEASIGSLIGTVGLKQKDINAAIDAVTKGNT